MTLQPAEQVDKKDNGFSLEKVAELTEMLSDKTGAAISQIDHINGETQVLAINALIEASRAGEVGKAFSVVAEEMSKLSKKIEATTDNLRRESMNTMSEMEKIVKTQITSIKGIRLSDLALTNIDLIDRNLYERSCDVRWWAKEGSLVSAAMDRNKQNLERASNRMSTILDSYTVYLDLVICDTEGRVLANGRPQQFRSVDTNHRDTRWFKTGLETRTKDDFGFQTVHKSSLVNDQLAVIFSCALRENGNEDGNIVGVLGVVLNWQALAHKIIENTPISGDERANSRICIVDNDGLVLADSMNKVLQSHIRFSGMETLFSEKKGFIMTDYENSDSCVAHALSPGYETYASGWHSLILQRMKKSRTKN
jgi:Methyl-accepting chemotaxis protein (MCP) signalling domain